MSHQLSHAAQPGICFAAASTDRTAQGRGRHPSQAVNTRDIGPAQAYAQLAMNDVPTLSAAQCVKKLVSLPWHHHVQGTLSCMHDIMRHAHGTVKTMMQEFDQC